MPHNEDVINHLLDNIGIAMKQKIRTSLLRSNIPAWVSLEDNVYDSISHYVDQNGLHIGSSSPHAVYTEYGRRSGRAPPFEPIHQWVRNKITSAEPAATKIAGSIQHKIATQGVKPSRFLYKAVAEFVSENAH